MKFDLTISASQINQAYQQALKSLASTTTLKGFRPGKAPLSAVEKHHGQSNVQNQALEQLLPKAYLKQIKAKKLKPISYPDIKLRTVEKSGDYVFEVEVPQTPDIELGDFGSALKKAFTSGQIWTPGKDNKPPANDPDEDLRLVFKTLLDTCNLQVPQLLIDRETNRVLSRLLQQIDQLGLTLEQYSQSLNKTVDSLKDEYKQIAVDNLKLEFILQAIATKLNLTVSDSEVDSFIAQFPQEKSKNDFSSKSARLDLKLILLKRKTIQSLIDQAKS